MSQQSTNTRDVYRIIDRETGKAQGVYCRDYRDEYDFTSVRNARVANVHGIYEDEERYRIAKYRVTYELLEEDAME